MPGTLPAPVARGRVTRAACHQMTAGPVATPGAVGGPPMDRALVSRTSIVTPSVLIARTGKVLAAARASKDAAGPPARVTAWVARLGERGPERAPTTAVLPSRAQGKCRIRLTPTASCSAAGRSLAGSSWITAVPPGRSTRCLVRRLAVVTTGRPVVGGFRSRRCAPDSGGLRNDHPGAPVPPGVHGDRISGDAVKCSVSRRSGPASRVRLSSKKPSVPATSSDAVPQPAGRLTLGAGVTTGPKKATCSPSGPGTWITGVPTSSADRLHAGVVARPQRLVVVGRVGRLGERRADRPRPGRRSYQLRAELLLARGGSGCPWRCRAPEHVVAELLLGRDQTRPAPHR